MESRRFMLPVNYDRPAVNETYRALDIYKGDTRDRKVIVCQYVYISEETDLVGVIARINSFGLRPAFPEELLSCGEVCPQDFDETEVSDRGQNAFMAKNERDVRPVIVIAVGAANLRLEGFWLLNTFPYLHKENGVVVMREGSFGSRQYRGWFLGVTRS
mgnify:CR=1 FL=1